MLLNLLSVSVTFGVSIDYSVFILVRIREQLDGGANHEQAVPIGVRRTGGVITGAALMMVAVFATFAPEQLTSPLPFGEGLHTEERCRARIWAKNGGVCTVGPHPYVSRAAACVRRCAQAPS